ncbi:hypothetical protein [Luteimonas deserti]|uniref:Uncharacterized protein n=1 Tax=Luteimonas deserti TaxID=2752306 RepID=A0A7Z0QP87_9GAMM|nr:hypothetical protein [Luteimonas deserti]NYZ62289.1 hypothetical protein [Luteimonas deserti]
MSWDPVQIAALDALGHVRYRVHMPGQTLPEDALLDALLRASGRGRDDADAFALYRSFGALDALRRADAKRALWPRLRGLRPR